MLFRKYMALLYYQLQNWCLFFYIYILEIYLFITRFAISNFILLRYFLFCFIKICVSVFYSVLLGVCINSTWLSRRALRSTSYGQIVLSGSV